MRAALLSLTRSLLLLLLRRRRRRRDPQTFCLFGAASTERENPAKAAKTGRAQPSSDPIGQLTSIYLFCLFLSLSLSPIDRLPSTLCLFFFFFFGATTRADVVVAAAVLLLLVVVSPLSLSLSYTDCSTLCFTLLSTVYSTLTDSVAGEHPNNIIPGVPDGPTTTTTARAVSQSSAVSVSVQKPTELSLVFEQKRRKEEENVCLNVFSADGFFCFFSATLTILALAVFWSLWPCSPPLSSVVVSSEKILILPLSLPSPPSPPSSSSS